MNKAAQAYFQTKVSTTDQGRLLLMLYDGALQFLQQAREKMLEKDYAAKGLLISRVIDIINELSGSLNMEKGGTLAENLNNLYFLCTARLLQANLKMNVEQLDSVSAILSGLRSAYAQILDKPEAKQAVAQIARKMQPDASMSQRAAPITAPMMTAPAAVSQLQARQAYGRPPAAPAATPEAPPTAGLVTTPAQLPPPPAPAPPPSFTEVAREAGMPVPQTPQPLRPEAPEARPPVAPAAATAAPTATTPSAPSPAPSAAGGFGKRLAAYGKLAQGR